MPEIIDNVANCHTIFLGLFIFRQIIGEASKCW
jgi:hypothetical protein